MPSMGDSKLKPFQSMAEQNPVQNNKVAQGLQAARAATLQQQVASAPAAVNTQRAAQQLGAQQAQQAGQIQLQAAQQTVQDQQKIAQAALAAKQQQAAVDLGRKQLASKARQELLTDKLSQVDRGLKSKLLDESISFEKDEMGRNLFNERQLLDYKLQSTQSDIALQQYEQNAAELSQKRTQMLQMAYKKIEQELSQTQQRGQQSQANAQILKLQQAKIELEQKLQREANRKKNRAAMISAAGTIAGAVIGGVASGGNPAGVAAGSSIGGGVGGVIASQE